MVIPYKLLIPSYIVLPSILKLIMVVRKKKKTTKQGNHRMILPHQ